MIHDPTHDPIQDAVRVRARARQVRTTAHRYFSITIQIGYDDPS
jgi:hypothetical protein